MLSIHDSLLRADDGRACRLRSLAWPGAAIVDACAVDAPYGANPWETEDGAVGPHAIVEWPLAWLENNTKGNEHDHDQ
ncbi:hypothetical protein [Massilia rubra]|uniref:Uncharacterized protein n=1 Tax=Massilia rubra TaxID=2607910 RepID=A0ABX0LFM8_9BURK|nr:hypothetical protein [Massilia rubra]NHZ33042.1 hypothetical protein [Massilia rubra]